jgi:hypothetical protein
MVEGKGESSRHYDLFRMFQKRTLADEFQRNADGLQ